VQIVAFHAAVDEEFVCIDAQIPAAKSIAPRQSRVPVNPAARLGIFIAGFVTIDIRLTEQEGTGLIIRRIIDDGEPINADVAVMPKTIRQPHLLVPHNHDADNVARFGRNQNANIMNEMMSDIALFRLPLQASFTQR
jgi:hypothetical protein